MSTILTNNPSRIAAKPYRCFYCGQNIPIGEKHVYRTGVGDGDFWTMRAHPECDEYAAKNWDYDDYEFHEPGEFVRPARKQPENMLARLEEAGKTGLDGSPGDPVSKWAFEEIQKSAKNAEYWENRCRANAKAHNAVEDERFDLLQKNKGLETDLAHWKKLALDFAVKTDRLYYENRDLLYGALTLAMQKVEKMGASKELTDLVVLLGDIKRSIGNCWNPADPYAIKSLVTTLSPEIGQYESRTI